MSLSTSNAVDERCLYDDLRRRRPTQRMQLQVIAARVAARGATLRIASGASPIAIFRRAVRTPLILLAILGFVGCAHEHHHAPSRASATSAAPPAATPLTALPLCTSEAPAITGTGVISRPTPDQPRRSSGELSPHEIREVVRANLPRVEACVDEWNRADAGPTTEYTRLINFKIHPTGTVSDVCARKLDLPEPAIGSCIGEVFASLRFPSYQHGVIDVTYPFRLELAARPITR